MTLPFVSFFITLHVHEYQGGPQIIPVTVSKYDYHRAVERNVESNTVVVVPFGASESFFLLEKDFVE